MDRDTGNCPICNSDETLIHPQYDRNTVFYACPVCGRYELDWDLIQSRDYIMLELLKSIRESRFVVVDLSDYNNGACFEEGYAMGLGKAVIQVCKKGTELHFDAAQKNTIVFESTEDLSVRLTKRIKATID